MLAMDANHALPSMFLICSSELPPAATPLEPQELGWLASALFNVGVDLHGCKQYAAAAEAMQAALVPAVASLQTAMDAGSSSEVRWDRGAVTGKV